MVVSASKYSTLLCFRKKVSGATGFSIAQKIMAKNVAPEVRVISVQSQANAKLTSNSRNGQVLVFSVPI